MSAADILRRLVEKLTARFDYYACYAATVVQQNGDGTVDLTFDHPRLPPMQGVAVRPCIPGLKLESIDAGTRLLVTFENGDPSKPTTFAWSAPHAVLSFNGGTEPIARKTDPVDCGSFTVAAASTGTTPVTTLTFTYTPPGGTAQVVTVTGLLGAGVSAPTPPTFSLTGKISDGNHDVKA